MTKLRVAFRNFAKTPKKRKSNVRNGVFSLHYRNDTSLCFPRSYLNLSVNAFKSLSNEPIVPIVHESAQALIATRWLKYDRDKL